MSVAWHQNLNDGAVNFADLLFRIALDGFFEGEPAIVMYGMGGSIEAVSTCDPRECVLAYYSRGPCEASSDEDVVFYFPGESVTISPLDQEASFGVGRHSFIA